MAIILRILGERMVQWCIIEDDFLSQCAKVEEKWIGGLSMEAEENMLGDFTPVPSS